MSESCENMTERSHFVPSHLYQGCNQQVQYLCPHCLFHFVLLFFFLLFLRCIFYYICIFPFTWQLSISPSKRSVDTVLRLCSSQLMKHLCGSHHYPTILMQKSFLVVTEYIALPMVHPSPTAPFGGQREEVYSHTCINTTCTTHNTHTHTHIHTHTHTHTQVGKLDVGFSWGRTTVKGEVGG